MEKKEYGTIETEHIAVCQCCEEKKIVRLFLTVEAQEVKVCVECYMNEETLKV